MTFEKNEVRTGLLVLVTVGVLVAALLIVGAPGLFKKQKSYRIFFDNAAGVKPGAAVALAGRSQDAKVYRDATARMSQLGLLGEQVIDFIEGSEDAGAAESGYTFVGERQPDFSESIPRIIRVLEPVASNATLTLDDLRKTIASLNVFFDKEGELQGALAQIKNVGANLAATTAKDGSLGKSLDNIQKLTAGLSDKDGELQSALGNLRKTTDQLNKDDNLAKTLDNFAAASRRANATLKDANALVASITPTLTQTMSNLTQMTDTLKRQPWRLVYPTTKKYDNTPPTTTVATVPREQGGPATLITRERADGRGASTTTVRPTRSDSNGSSRRARASQCRSRAPKRRRSIR